MSLDDIKDWHRRTQNFLSDVAQIPGVTVEGNHVYVGSAAPVPRACSWSGCGKVLHAAAGFVEVTHQPTGDLESYCSLECLHWQLHEELR